MGSLGLKIKSNFGLSKVVSKFAQSFEAKLNRINVAKVINELGGQDRWSGGQCSV